MGIEDLLLLRRQVWVTLREAVDGPPDRPGENRPVDALQHGAEIGRRRTGVGGAQVHVRGQRGRHFHGRGDGAAALRVTPQRHRRIGRQPIHGQSGAGGVEKHAARFQSVTVGVHAVVAEADVVGDDHTVSLAEQQPRLGDVTAARSAEGRRRRALIALPHRARGHDDGGPGPVARPWSFGNEDGAADGDRETMRVPRSEGDGPRRRGDLLPRRVTAVDERGGRGHHGVAHGKHRAGGGVGGISRGRIRPGGRRQARCRDQADQDREGAHAASFHAPIQSRRPEKAGRDA